MHESHPRPGWQPKPPWRDGSWSRKCIACPFPSAASGFPQHLMATLLSTATQTGEEAHSASWFNAHDSPCLETRPFPSQMATTAQDTTKKGTHPQKCHSHAPSFESQTMEDALSNAWAPILEAQSGPLGTSTCQEGWDLGQKPPTAYNHEAHGAMSWAHLTQHVPAMVGTPNSPLPQEPKPSKDFFAAPLSIRRATDQSKPSSIPAAQCGTSGPVARWSESPGYLGSNRRISPSNSGLNIITSPTVHVRG